MTEKIFRSIMTAAVGVLLASLLIIFGFLYDYFGSVQTRQLWAELELAVSGTEVSGIDYLTALGGESDRLTLIAPDGTVLYDTQADQDTMENHADRAEVREALETGRGSEERYSDTLLEKTVYCAERLSDGSVLRISISRATMGTLILGTLQPICVVIFLLLIFAFFLADRLARHIVEPLNALDLDRPLENKTYDEIAPLLRRISLQRNQIDDQLRELQQKQDEFTQITSNMREGLVLLDDRGIILSINPAAQELFQVDGDSVGRDFLLVERSREFRDAIAKATEEGHGEIVFERNGKIYQAELSRIDSDGTTAGVVLLTFDITAKADAERTRREFTANVSHELKTPLTAIIGSSELLQSGLVKAEDIPRFVGHIRKEATRLLSLIEDIMRLSRLDEGVELPKETVELSAVAEEVAEQLREKAEEHHVSIRVQAEPCTLRGVPRLFEEIVYNLTENAVKYNVEGGTVTLTVTRDGVLTVTDTGVGIPSEHQERVFERFYRVDKSHSKDIGGTGLGLSIVKHACAYLGASIELQSEVGKGTTVRVRFAKGE